MSACCKPQVQLFVNLAMNDRIVHCSIISPCQSAATSKIVKRFWATVRSVIASVVLYLFIFLLGFPSVHFHSIFPSRAAFRSSDVLEHVLSSWLDTA